MQRACAHVPLYAVCRARLRVNARPMQFACGMRLTHTKPCRSRHTAYVPHASAEGLNRYLLTLLAQRRELQSQDLADALQQPDHARGAQQEQQLGAAWTYNSVSSASLETERRELQKETTLGLVHVHGELEADALRGAVEAAGAPLSGACQGCIIRHTIHTTYDIRHMTYGHFKGISPPYEPRMSPV
jgi:hypothetical protein